MAHSAKRRENRKAQRLPLKLRIRFKQPKVKGWSACTCKDVSGMGFCLLVSEPLKKGDTLNISIDTPYRDKPMNALCRVSWCSEVRKGKYNVGLEVIKIQEPILFVEFMCDNMINLGLFEEK